MAILTTLAVGLGTTSCGDSSTPVTGFSPADLAQLQASAGDSQVDTVGAVLSTPLTVHAVSPGGQPVAGVSVQWTFSSGGGSTTADGTFTQDLTTTTDNTGQTSVYWQLGTTAGDQVATATLLTTNQKKSSPPIKFHSHGKAGGPASLSIFPDSVTLAGGSSAKLTPTVLDRWGNTVSGTSVNWSSSDSSVALVGSDGTVTGLAKGKATITATDGQAAGTASVTVSTSVALQNATVTLTPDSISLTSIDATVQLSAVAKDSSGGTMTNPGFSWRSLASSIASVSSSGLVTAKAVGATLIVVTAACCTGADTAMVAVSQVAARVTISPDSLNLQVGNSSQLSATVFDASNNVIAGAPVTWSSSNDSVASVDSTGLVAARAVGAVTITAASAGPSPTSASSGPSAASSSVSGQAAVLVSASTATPPPDTVKDLRAVTATDSSVTLAWTQVDDGTGSPANYTLRYATPTMYWGQASATDVPVNGTSIGATETYTFKGLQAATSYQFQLVSYRGTLNVNEVFGGWSNIASGSTTGTGAPQTPKVTVTPASLSFTSIGATAQLSAVATDSTGNTVSNPGFTWTSLASSIASVTSSGLVTAMGVGTTAIVVAATGFGADTAAVTVSAPTGVQSSDLLPGCTVSASNTVNWGSGGCPSTTPSGWSLADVQGFESGSYNSGESATTWGNSSSIVTAQAHTGTHSQDTYITHSFAGYGLKIAGSVINARDVYVSYWRYVTDSNPGYGYMDTNWFYGVRAPPGYGVGFGLQADAGVPNSCCVTTTGIGELYGAIPSGLTPWGDGGGTVSYPPGAWQHIEVRIKANDPGSTNGEVQLYLNGSLIYSCTAASGCPHRPSGMTPGNLVGSTDYSTGDLYIGGDWGKNVWYSDSGHTTCSTSGDMGMGPVNLPGMGPGNPDPCPGQAPPNGYVPYFHIYIDDVIVLKR